MEAIEITNGIIDDVLNIQLIEETEYDDEHICGCTVSGDSDVYLIKTNSSKHYDGIGGDYAIGYFLFYMSDDEDSNYNKIDAELFNRIISGDNQPSIKEIILKGMDVIFISDTKEIEDLEDIISVKKVSDIL